MKKSSFLALAVAPLILGAPMAAQAQESVATDPVGFVKLTLEPGLQAIGASLVNPAVAAGSVASNDGSSITLEGEVGTLAAGAYYVEVAGDGVFSGDRFEVNASGTAGSTIAIDAASPNNTIDLGSIDLTGYSVRVRPHVTLGQVFPADELSIGDELLILDPATGGFGTYTLTQHPLTQEINWSRQGANQDDLVLAPGQGALFRNSSSATVELTTVMGEVRTNHFRQPLMAGLNQISEGHPLDNSPESRMMTADNGFELGDEVLVFDPTTGGFQTYTLTQHPLTQEIGWTRAGVNHDASEIFLADKSVIVRKQTADPDYEAPKTF